MDERLGLPQGAFTKIDAEEDELFYEPPRLVCHIDDGAIAALTEFYRRVLPPGGILLDLMSSWISHLPPEIDYAEVIGHGMNASELAANPRLRRWFVQKHRFEKLIASGAPGRSTRARSRSTTTGCCRYWIETQIIAASTLAVASGSCVSRLRFWTNQRLSRGLAASSVAFMPWPITSA